jgi:hypothetical protein
MNRLTSYILVASGCLAACASPAPKSCEDAPDIASRFVCEGDFELDIGTGVETFEPLADGDTHWLYPGFQGAQHLVVSLRGQVATRDMPLERAQLTLSVLDPEDGAHLTDPMTVGAAFSKTEDGLEVIGFFYVFGTPDPILDRSILLTAELEPVGGDALGRGAREVNVAWAPQDTGMP